MHFILTPKRDKFRKFVLQVFLSTITHIQNDVHSVCRNNHVPKCSPRSVIDLYEWSLTSFNGHWPLSMVTDLLHWPLISVNVIDLFQWSLNSVNGQSLTSANGHWHLSMLIDLFNVNWLFNDHWPHSLAIDICQWSLTSVNEWSLTSFNGHWPLSMVNGFCQWWIDSVNGYWCLSIVTN